MARKPLTDDELLILLKIVQTFELSYLIDDPSTVVDGMKVKFEESLAKHGAQLAPEEETRERLYRLGVRIRQAFGEALNDAGSPEIDV